MSIKPPTSVTPEILEFCQQLAPGQAPFYIEISEGERVDNCHGNVATLVQERGGSQLRGWSIWRDTHGRYLEAIYHSIYVHSSGEQIDITPDADGERRRLFVPVPDDTYQGRPKPSRYKALVENPTVIEALKLFEEASELQASIRDDELVPPNVDYKVKKLREKGSRLLKT